MLRCITELLCLSAFRGIPGVSPGSQAHRHRHAATQAERKELVGNHYKGLSSEHCCFLLYNGLVSTERCHQKGHIPLQSVKDIRAYADWEMAQWHLVGIRCTGWHPAIICSYLVSPLALLLHSYTPAKKAIHHLHICTTDFFFFGICFRLPTQCLFII